MQIKKGIVSFILFLVITANAMMGTVADSLVTDNLGESERSAVSTNLAVNGGFESGDSTNWSKFLNGGTLEITNEFAYEGQYSAFVKLATVDGMLFPKGISMPCGKRYLLSFATRLEPTSSVKRTMKIYNYDTKGINMPYTDEASAVVNGQDWTRIVITADTVDNTSNHILRVSPTTWTSTPYYLDGYYVGELVIADLEYTGATTIEIPKYKEEAKTLSFNVVAKNQLGTVNGLYDETVSLELLGGEIPGVSLDGTTLTVTEDACVQTVTVRASCTPSYPGAAQTSVYKDISVDLTAGSPELIPEARNVNISGIMGKDQVLTASYKYYSINSVTEGDSTCQWFYSSKEEGPYYPIEGETSLTYTVDEAHKDSFIYFEVFPKNSNGTQGLAAKSQIVRRPCEPTATDVKIIGTMAVDTVLTGSYSYFDANGDKEGNSTFRWLKSDSQTGTFVPIPGATGMSYTITEDDINSYLKFEVTPKATVVPEGKAAFLSIPYLCAARAAVEDLEINKISNELYTASYTYKHPHGYGEGETRCNWYLNGHLIGTDMKVYLNEGTTGTLKLEVIPMCIEKPFDGVSAYTEISIRPKRTNNGGSGGGGFLRPSAGIVPIPEKPVEPEVSEPVQEEDVNKYWASDAIDFVLKKGIMNMPKKDDFCPDMLVTRAEFVSYIIRGLNKDKIPYKYSFNDVLATDQYADELQAALEIGMISEAENFYPDRSVARDEICKILLYAIGEENCSDQDETPEFANLSDKEQVAEWAVGFVRKVIKVGLMNGVGNNEFAPRENITRAQTAVLVMRTSEYLSSKQGEVNQ